MLYALTCQPEFPSRRERAAALHDLGDRLLFHAVRQEFGIHREELVLRRTSQGKPYFENSPVRFSISHCPGLVCCALCRSPVGVDAEVVRPYRPRLAERICTEDELEAVRSASDPSLQLTVLWTLKESRMKLAGAGLSFGFRNAAFVREGENFVSAEPGIQARCYTAISGFAVSVCGTETPPEAPILLEPDQLF